MLRYSRKLGEKLAIIGVAGSFAFAPVVISPVMAQTLGTDAGQEDMVTDEREADSLGSGDDAYGANDTGSESDANAASSGDENDETAADENGEGVDQMQSSAISEGDASQFFVMEQADDQVLANRYIGKTVYNDAMEKVGKVNDLVFTMDGGIEAAIIGVGGFLGLGEKEVAVRFNEIDILEDPESSDIELRISATEEQLAQAPAFMTKDDRLAAIRAEEAERAADQNPVGGAPAAAPQEEPAAPAD